MAGLRVYVAAGLLAITADVLYGCKFAKLPFPKATSDCVPEEKCLRPYQLTRFNSLCSEYEVCCLLTWQRNTLRVYANSSKPLTIQNQFKKSRLIKQEYQKKNISRHSVSKRDLPIDPTPLVVQNHPPGWFYPYPLPMSNNLQRKWYIKYFQKHQKYPLEIPTVSNRIMNKNESSSIFFYTAPPIEHQPESTFISKMPQKDSVIFEEQEYELHDPNAENVKRNFERYLKEEQKLAAVKNYSDLLIDERIISDGVRYNPGVKSKKYCQQYQKYVMNRNTVRYLFNSLPWNTKERRNCVHPMPLIVGGLKAYTGEFPHMAGVGFDRGSFIEFLCGGSLISPRFILTAAHCARTKWGSPVVVRLGVTNLIRHGGQNIDVESVIIHPEYKPPACNNDIALLKIKAGVKLGPNLRPACLPEFDTTADKSRHLATATGWGRTGYGKFSSPNLLKVTLQIIDKHECEKSFLNDDSTRLATGITDQMICATGYLEPSHDTCQGDSGGPLQSLLPSTQCMYQIIGITSFGKLCGTGLPGVYTKVSAFLPWIEDIVWP